ncbi:hypothetical protein ACHAQA_010013 [Verticillium albo-atrum]
MLPPPSLVHLVLLAIVASRPSAASLTHATRHDLRSCLTGVFEGAQSRAQFQDETDFIPKDVNYFNLNLPYKPFAVVYPETKEEISRTLSCAVKYERKVQARSGGRDFINKSLGGADDAIVVDMKHFNHLSVNKTTGIATAGPGIALQSLVAGLNEAGCFMPHDSSPTVGVGGHIMVGGIGYNSRENGLAIDALREVEVVLSNGTVTRATKSMNPNLFWAMGGAGASFGIATEFKFQTKPVLKELTTFSYNYATTDKARFEVLPPTDYGPEHVSYKLSGSGTLMKHNFYVSGIFLGPKVDFDALNMDQYFPPGAKKSVQGGISWIDYMNGLFRVASAIPSQAHSYVKDLAVGKPVDSGADNWMCLFDWYGGAVNDVATGATPFPHRDLFYFLSAYVATDKETSEKTMKFIDDAVLTLQDGKPASYLHYAGVPNLRLSGKPQEKYWGSNLPRLERIKAVVDPNDLFSSPQNIKPRRS